MSDVSDEAMLALRDLGWKLSTEMLDYHVRNLALWQEASRQVDAMERAKRDGTWVPSPDREMAYSPETGWAWVTRTCTRHP